MRCRSTKAILMIVGLAAWSAPAMAVTTEEIKSGLRDWLASALLQSTAGVSATLDGEVSVTAAGAQTATDSNSDLQVSDLTYFIIPRYLPGLRLSSAKACCKWWC